MKIALGPRRASGLTAAGRASYGLKISKKEGVCFEGACPELGGIQKNTGRCSMPKMYSSPIVIENVGLKKG